MLNILYKELKLSASKLSYLFIAFSFMFFVPGYPILCGVFFVTLGLFKSFQNYIETNDIVFSAILPISKNNIVKGKFYFVCIIEMCSIFLMSICVIVRNTLLINSTVYRTNFMMNANGFALAIAFVIFSLFNLVFVAGFFKTTYKRTKPFIAYMVVAFLLIFVGESLFHFPQLAFLNAFGSDYLQIQLLILLLGFIIYLVITYLAYKKACDRFEKIDL